MPIKFFQNSEVDLSKEDANIACFTSIECDGDIGLCCMYEDETYSIYGKQIEKGEVDRDIHLEGNPNFQISFKNKKSIDVWIKVLIELKEKADEQV